MHVKIKDKQGQTKTYTKISNISFAPEVDITGQSLPVNEFSVDIYTQDEIEVAERIALYDGRLQDGEYGLWADYRVVSAERKTVDIVTVRAESILAMMDRSYVDAVIYTQPKKITEIIYELFNHKTSYYSIANNLQSATVKGYFPQQSRKERLQWICFAVGAYVRTFFTNKVDIRKVDTTKRNIPVKKTFWRPSLINRDYVKSITIPYFSFTQAEEEQAKGADEHIKVGNDYYIVDRRSMTLNNDDIPSNIVAMEEIEVEDVYIVNENNANAILNRLGEVYFQNEELEADIINNADYKPAEKVSINVDPPTDNTGRIVEGYIDSCDFSFGMQARSKIHMVVRESFNTTKLIVNYIHVKGNVKLGSEQYNFPVGYSYAIDNPYIDQVNGQYQKVFYPKKKQATGVMGSGTNVNDQYFDDALIYDTQNNRLDIISVNSITDNGEGVISIE